ncbi:MAG: peptidoglycan bridge formation glycyltransferase FemA/FemB family protein [Anaerolineales bacterium]|nr:peptidoglycan bridge formation glycyltransferase FemA/FemB family protein [Anaerolineales bacterium]
MPEVSLQDWNAFLNQHPAAHLLQSAEWGELKSAFGWQAVRIVAGEIGAQMLFRQLPLGFKVAYLPRGPVAGRPAPDAGQQFWEEVEALCRAWKAVFLKVEPDAWEASDQGPVIRNPLLVESRYSIQPRRTVVVNLRDSEEDILGRMKQKCRYNIRLAAKRGVTVRPWDDLDGFHKMMLVTGERDIFGVHAAAYYRKAYDLFHTAGMAELLVAEYEGQPLAALMAFARGTRAWYLYGASTDAERNRMPAYLLQWEAMRWARLHGAEEYDLYGVPDADEATLEAQFESRRDGLWGVYRFKRGFGGELKRAVPALERVYNPLLYRLYLWRMAGREGG